MKYIRISLDLALMLRKDAVMNGRSMTKQLEYILSKHYNENK